MPLDDPERYLVRSSRPSEIALGLVVGALSLLFVSFASYVLWWGIRHGLLKGPYDSGWLGYVSVPIVLYVLGLPGSWVAFRLLSGRARRDGGLFSPAVLRLGGALLLLAPWPWLIAHPSNPWHWWHCTTLTGGGVACWILAARRERTDAPDGSHSGSPARPLDGT